MVEVLQKNGIPLCFEARAKGTAPSELLDAIGLGGTTRVLTAGLLPRANVPAVFGAINKALSYHKRGAGIAVTLPLTGVQNSILQLTAPADCAGPTAEKEEHTMNKVISTDKAPGAIGPYSQAIVANDILYTSGQIPIIPETGELVDGDIKAQAEQVCKNLGEILKEAHASFDSVIKTTCFLADMNDFAAFNEVYAKYFVSKPARSCVAVKTLPKNVLCEVELIASVGLIR